MFLISRIQRLNLLKIRNVKQSNVRLAITTGRNRAHHLSLKLEEWKGKITWTPCTENECLAGGRKTSTATRRNDFVRIFATLTFERTVRPAGAGALAGSRERGGGSQAHRPEPVWLSKNVAYRTKDRWGRMDGRKPTPTPTSMTMTGA